MGWLGRGIGDFGSQVGGGYDINQQWKQRAQDMAFQAAKQKQDALMAPLLLTHLQEQIKQMQAQQPAGIEHSATGGISGVTWDPNTGTYKLQQLAPGQTAPAKVTTPFEAWQAKNIGAPLEDWYKLSRAPAKTEEGYSDVKVDNKGNLWGVRKDNGKFEQIPASAKFPVPKEGGAGEGGVKTPFELWKANNPKGTYEQWMQASKQEDRGDATKAVQAVINAQKALQSLEVGIQKSNKTFSVWNPRTYGRDPALAAIAQQAVNDYEQKRQDAVAKLTEAGMPIPAWLTQQGGQATPPPPAGFVINK